MEQLKKFKKPLVLLSLALVLALVWTTGASTYAKYITSKTVTPQTATVAKWGFVINANTENLFGANYGKSTDGLSSVVTKGNGINVIAETTKDSSDNEVQALIVAPGTTGSMTFSISGTAEVLSKITVTMGTDSKDVSLTKTTKNDGSADKVETYYPILWTLTKTVETKDSEGKTKTTVNNLVENKSLADLIVAINGKPASDGKSAVAGVCNEASIAPNTSVADTTYTISWAWAFENTSSDIAGLSADEADTYLGQYANNIALPVDAKGKFVYTANKTVSFNLTITVEQIQQKAA